MSLSFQQVSALWKSDKRRWVKPSTYAEYVYHINKHLLPFFGGQDALPLNDTGVQQFADNLVSDGLSKNTVRDALMVLRMILKFGARLGAWPYREFKVHFSLESTTGRPVTLLSQADETLLLKYLQGNFSFRNLGLLICMHTGLRIGEICALQWRDIDVKAGVIHINKTVQRLWLSDGEEKINALSVHSPKTLTSKRDIPISRSLMALLKPLSKIVQDNCYLVSNAPEPLEPRYYRDYFNKLQMELGIQKVRFHALRHSFATRCIQGKCDYKTVSVILGHSSISTTMDLYVHPGYAEKKLAIEKMARLLK